MSIQDEARPTSAALERPDYPECLLTLQFPRSVRVVLKEREVDGPDVRIEPDTRHGFCDGALRVRLFAVPAWNPDQPRCGLEQEVDVDPVRDLVEAASQWSSRRQRRCSSKKSMVRC